MLHYNDVQLLFFRVTCFSSQVFAVAERLCLLIVDTLRT